MKLQCRRRRGAWPERLLSAALPALSVFMSWGCGGPSSEGRTPQDHPWQLLDTVVWTVNRGVGCMEQYDYDRAVRLFEAAFDMAPELDEVRVNLAIALFNRNKKGDLDWSVELLEGVLEKDPDDVRALYMRGIIHQYSGEDAEAIPLFQRVVELEPRDSSAWYLLGRSKGNLKQECRPELERAIEENPNLISGYYHLMRVEQLAGNSDEAAVYREKFTALFQSKLKDEVKSPEYRRMGALSLVRPLALRPGAGVTFSELSAGETTLLVEGTAEKPLRGPRGSAGSGPSAQGLVNGGVSAAFADINGDGRQDMATPVAARGPFRELVLYLGTAEGTFLDVTEKAGLAGVGNATACSFGDYDNDGNVDLYVCRAGPNRLFRGKGDGTFEDVTQPAGAGGSDTASASALFLDADHDADLDIYVCNVSSADGRTQAANLLLNNNADGTFTDIADSAGVACEDAASLAVVPVRADNDRDTDLLVFHRDQPMSLFLNDRGGSYHPGDLTGTEVRGAGGVAQDFDGDGRPDLLVLGAAGAPDQLLLSGGAVRPRPSGQLPGVLESVASWQEGEATFTRVGDVDLDGDLDIMVVAGAGHLLLNDGNGNFVLKAGLWPEASNGKTIGAELVDRNADGFQDLIRLVEEGAGRIESTPVVLVPPPNWVAVTPTGERSRDQRMLSASSGFGTRLELRAGAHRQVVTYTGLQGGPSQSASPVILGLDGARAADYLALLWTDGVTQSETLLAGGTHHVIGELERKKSSCPVLFSWDGEHFAFVTDFAGVGGLGYRTGPGEYARPQGIEHVKIEPHQLRPRDGCYELRVTEPMEEVAYLDRLELLAVDHPRDFVIHPDERLAVTGPPPTHRLLSAERRIFPVSARDGEGRDCTDRLMRVDRVYATRPRLDARFFGFAEPHSVVVDFGERLGEVADQDDVFLFVNGYIEYPYSQTIYAAAQAGVRWESLRVDRQIDDGPWVTIIPDAGAPGGMGRTFTVDLTGKLLGGRLKLRLETNLEIGLDQLFVARHRESEQVEIRSVPLTGALLRRLGFPAEYSPDGKLPRIYSYDLVEPTYSFQLPRGRYTRYGAVEELLRESDDRYVILGSGDEVALSFDARALPAPGPGRIRSFLLVSHAYCKDMDLYTAEPDTVEPLPFHGMSLYPYGPDESYPDTESVRRYQEEYNTRVR